MNKESRRRSNAETQSIFSRIPHQALSDLDSKVKKLRDGIRNGAPATDNASAVADLCVDRIERILDYTEQFDQVIGYQLFLEDQPSSRINTALRLLGQLNRMFLEQIGVLLKCVGGTQAIAIEQIVEWGKLDPARAQLLERLLSNVAELSRRQKRRSRKRAQDAGPLSSESMVSQERLRIGAPANYEKAKIAKRNP